MNRSGFARFRVTCPGPCRIYLTFDELLKDDGSIDIFRIACANTAEWIFEKGGSYDVELIEPNAFKFARAGRLVRGHVLHRQGVLHPDGLASVAAVYLVRDVLGVRSIDPTTRTIRFEPDATMPLEYCRAVLPLPDGQKATLGWKREFGRLVDECHLPQEWTLVTDDHRGAGTDGWDWTRRCWRPWRPAAFASRASAR